jgi:hypothetical protein
MESGLAEEVGSATLERDLVTVRGAIALVASGVAVEIMLCGLGAPEEAAAGVAAESIAAGVPVSVVDGFDGPDLLVGPRQA